MTQWYDTWDTVQAPIRWEAADASEVKYLSVEDALERLSRHYDMRDGEIQRALLAGVQLRTPFAFYQYQFDGHR